MAQLAARRSHNPKVAGSIPVESRNLPVSLGGQDTRLSPERPGFNSRTGNYFYFLFILNVYLNKLYLSQTPIASMAEWSKAADLSSVLRCRRGFKPHSRHYFFILFFSKKKLLTYSQNKKLVRTGLEPATLGLLDQCSTN